jgi:two-component system NarL family sensor kinase
MLISMANAWAQAVPDSLLTRLNTTTNDSVRIRTLLDIGEFSEATSLLSSQLYYRKALGEAQKINNKSLIFSSLNDLGISHLENNKLDSAIQYFEKAVVIGRELGNRARVARVITNMGNVYMARHNRLMALDYYLKAANDWENAPDKRGLAALYANISSLLTDQKEYVKALEYGNKAFALAKQIDDQPSAVNALLNLSTTYSDLGQYDKELDALNRAVPLAIQGEDIEQIATVYHGLGDYYFQKKDYPASLNNYLRSHDYVVKMDNHFHLCDNYAALALVYFRLGDQAKAMKYIRLAEQLAYEVGSRANLKQIYQTRAEIEQKAGNSISANEYLNKRMLLSDSLFESETSGKIAEVEAKYQNEKKQSQIVQLEKDKEIQSLSIRQKSLFNYLLVGIACVLLLIVFLIYRNLRYRKIRAAQQHEIQNQRIRELEKDKQLVAVDSLLQGQEDERSRLAKDLHDGLGGLLSGVKFSLSNMKDNLIITADNMAVFERSLDLIDTSIGELRRVAHNMMPEMLYKFGLDEALKEYFKTINATGLLVIKYQTIGMENRLHHSAEIIIYRILQELLNNTMKHARATEVSVQLIREGTRLNVLFEDNGIGFDPKLSANQKGAGLLNVKSRVDYLKGQLDIHSVPGSGTLINMEFNI